jgi:hypothetical protein
MRTRSTFFRSAGAVLACLGLAILLAPPASAEAPVRGGDTVAISIAQDGTVSAVPSRLPFTKSDDTRTIILPSKARNGLNTTITCYVSSYGPGTPDGRVVLFGLVINCEGGVPMQLKADLQLYRYNFGEWENAPGPSEPRCISEGSPLLGPCYRQSACFQGGRYYYADAYLEAFDEENVYHDATFIYGPYWVGCLI